MSRIAEAGGFRFGTVPFCDVRFGSHFRPIDDVCAMSAYPSTAVELMHRNEPPLRAIASFRTAEKQRAFLQWLP
jgi:hypothetical protein